jgi:hypothetical protein
MMAQAPTQPNPREMWIDHETGLIHWPAKDNKQPEPLNGPTTGQAYKEFKEAEKKNAALMQLMKRQMLSRYQCTQCKKKFYGKFARIKWRNVDGVQTETLVCPDSKCDAPVIMIEDAMNLKAAPGGQI